MTDYLIEVKELNKVYGAGDAEVRALDRVSARVASGEFVAIVGPSGSGKSTLMSILGCLDRPTSGAYYLDGRDVSSLGKNELATVRNRQIGFVFQSFNLLPRLSALNNVLLPLLYNPDKALTETEHHDRAVAALEAVGLGHRLHHRPNQLSGGQQQRVAIARALVNRPSLILADEPTGNLDTKSSQEVMELLHQLNAQGVTLVMVTHEPDMAAEAEREIHMRDGQVVDGHSSPLKTVLSAE
jgi:putative ABC transport system ATP-binding protein